jgi:inosine-uridine nucleoside N-ribohydrolase
MAPKHRLIIDTDPGVDDTLAILLALSTDPEVLQVDLVSVTYGNVEVER